MLLKIKAKKQVNFKVENKGTFQKIDGIIVMIGQGFPGTESVLQTQSNVL